MTDALPVLPAPSMQTIDPCIGPFVPPGTSVQVALIMDSLLCSRAATFESL